MGIDNERRIFMLVTSDTMPPLLDGLGNRARNGRLLVVKGTSPDTEPIDLFMDREHNSPADNPIQLNSAGLMPPTGVYADAANGWCFLYDEHGHLVRSYPLQTEPDASSWVIPQDLTLKGNKTELDGLLRVAGLLQANVWIESQKTTAVDIEAKSFEATEAQTEVLELSGETINADYLVAKSSIDKTKNKASEWWDIFQIGCFGTYVADMNDKLAIGDIVKVTRFYGNAETIMSGDKDGATKATVQIIGQSGWLENSAYTSSFPTTSHAIYICIRVD